MRPFTSPTTLITALSLLAHSAQSATHIPSSPSLPYTKGNLVPVTCLNRTIETGEHITDPYGTLQYIPFPSCTESSSPLSFKYAQNGITNCTVLVTDPLFHLLEFYIHNDVPLSCRVPVLHSSAAAPQTKGHGVQKAINAQEVRKAGGGSADPVVLEGEDSGEGDPSGGGHFVPLVFALNGALQRSHLHVNTAVNVLLHSALEKGTAGRRDGSRIRGAGGYSSASRTKRIVIGDEVTFSFDVLWVSGDGVPSQKVVRGGGGLGVWLFGVLVGGCVAAVYFGGLRMDVKGLRGFGGKDVLPKYNGYGYGVQQQGSTQSSNGFGFGGGTGKRE